MIEDVYMVVIRTHTGTPPTEVAVEAAVNEAVAKTDSYDTDVIVVKIS